MAVAQSRVDRRLVVAVRRVDVGACHDQRIEFDYIAGCCNIVQCRSFGSSRSGHFLNLHVYVSSSALPASSVCVGIRTDRQVGGFGFRLLVNLPVC